MATDDEIEAMVAADLARALASDKPSEFVVHVTVRRSTLESARDAALAVLGAVPFFAEVLLTEYRDGYPIATHGPRDYGAPRCAGFHGGKVIRCGELLGCGLAGCPSLTGD